MALTIKRIERALAPGRYGDGGGSGLYLQVGSTGGKSWLFRFERDGRERWMGIGPLHTVDLTEARERARKARLLLLDGIDPLEQRRADKAARALEAAKSMTFEQASRLYYEAHESGWNNRKYRQQFKNTMRDYVLPKIGRLSVAAIDVGMVLKVIEPHWAAKAPTMNKVRARIEAILDWASVRGYRQGDNPARWKGHLSEALPAVSKIAKTEHHAALPYREVPAFMAKLTEQDGVAARALEFSILTAARTGEVTCAVWDEIDLAGKVWTIPARRMKAGKEHRVPLSDRAISLLRALPREGEYVFTSSVKRGAPISAVATMYRALRRIVADGVSVHGFRSSFSDWAHEQTSYDNHSIELSLAHSVGNAVERAYRRGDLFEKRRRLMAEWAKYCATPLAAATKGANVVALQAAR